MDERRKQLTEKQKGIVTHYSEACTHFRIWEGITYVLNDLWVRYRKYAINSHIYVGTTNLRGLPLKRTADTWGAANPGIEKSDTLPFRIRIMNELLLEEMRGLSGIGSLNHDHVAPFRYVVPYEKAFRARIEEFEEAFPKMAEHHPCDSTIIRSRKWLPKPYTFSTDLGTSAAGELSFEEDVFEKVSILDDLRIRLYGFRALISLLDNDLAAVVRTHHQAREGTLKNIYFSHLWYLFWPGQEIVTAQSNYQVYRVLNLSGGRRSVVPRGRPSTRITISDLVIDCLYIDYDGKQARPVPKSLAIKPYVGKRSVIALDVFPLQYLEQATKLKIIQRGRMFVEIAMGSHRRYKGLNLTNEDFHRLEDVCAPLCSR